MSYEIKMLLAYIRLRNVITIEKEMFANYVSKFENERRLTPSLTVEKFNYNQKMLEEDALEKSEKTARRILTGCLFFIVIVIIFARKTKITPVSVIKKPLTLFIGFKNYLLTCNFRAIFS